jgi:hypothetical protein
MGWPIKRSRHPRSTPGYLVVVDLPRTALNLVLSVVPNAELDAFIDVHTARRFLIDAVNVESGHLVEGHWYDAATWNRVPFIMLWSLRWTGAILPCQPT